jgi:hypothetical protein
VGPPESIGSDPFVKRYHGGLSRYPFYDDISDGSLCKNRSCEGPYELITNDQPRFFISSNLGNMPSTGRDPILEVRREMQFKLWVFAARAADVAFANRYQVLAHVHPFTISCWFTRRAVFHRTSRCLVRPGGRGENTAKWANEGDRFHSFASRVAQHPLPVVPEIQTSQNTAWRGNRRTLPFCAAMISKAAGWRYPFAPGVPCLLDMSSRNSNHCAARKCRWSACDFEAVSGGRINSGVSGSDLIGAGFRFRGGTQRDAGKPLKAIAVLAIVVLLFGVSSARRVHGHPAAGR